MIEVGPVINGKKSAVLCKLLLVFVIVYEQAYKESQASGGDQFNRNIVGL